MGLAERAAQRLGDILPAHQAAANRVVDIVVDVGDAVGKMDNSPFRRRGLRTACVMHNTIAHLGGQVERLDAVDHAQALFVVAEALRADFVQCGFARVAKRRMPEVVAEGNGFGQVFVQAQGARNGTPNLRNFEGMGQAGAVVVALRGDEYLCLVGQAAKRLGMDDAVAVTLETGAVRAGGQGPLPSSGGGGARRPAA